MEWTCFYLKFSVPDGDRFKQFQNKFEAHVKRKHKCTQDASCSFDGSTLHVFLKRTDTKEQLLQNVRVTWNTWVVGLGQPFECMALSEQSYSATAIERDAYPTQRPPNATRIHRDAYPSRRLSIVTPTHRNAYPTRRPSNATPI